MQVNKYSSKIVKTPICNVICSTCHVEAKSGGRAVSQGGFITVLFETSVLALGLFT